MAATNKKIDAIRRLILGPLYQECKDNPIGVKREDLEAHFEELKREGCIGGDCGFDEMIKLCQLKNHYPTCLSDDRNCIEGMGERSTGVKKFYYDQYKRAKAIEDESDESSSDEEEDEIECPICTMNEDENGIKLVETINNPEEEQGALSCGHLVHKSCLIRTAIGKGKDRAECPLCNKVFELTEVPVPVRNVNISSRDSLRRAVFNATQMSRSFEDIADAYDLTISELLERIEMTPEEASAYYSVPLESLGQAVNRRLEFEDDSEGEDVDDIPIIDALIERNYVLAETLCRQRNEREGDNDWINEDILQELFYRIKEETTDDNVQDINNVFNELMTEDYAEFYVDNINELISIGGIQKNIASKLLDTIIEYNYGLAFKMFYMSLQKTHFELSKTIIETYNRFQDENEEVATPPSMRGRTPTQVINNMVEEILDDYTIMNDMEDRDEAVDLLNEYFGEDDENDEDDEDEDDGDKIRDILRNIRSGDIEEAIRVAQRGIDELGNNEWIPAEPINELLEAILNFDRRIDLNNALSLFILMYNDNIHFGQNDLESITDSIVQIFRASTTKKDIAKLILLHIIKKDSVGMYYILLHILKDYDGVTPVIQNEIINFIFEAYSSVENVSRLYNETNGKRVLKRMLENVLEEDEFREWRNEDDVSELIRDWMRENFSDEE